MTPGNSHTFRFKITNDELKQILIGHLLNIGSITPAEKDYFTGWEPNTGTGLFAEFTVPAQTHEG